MSRDWHTLTREELDWAYDQRQHAANMQAVLQRLASAGADVQQRQRTWQRLAYGSAPIEQFDWYAFGQAQAPVLFFIHGGAWRSGQARDYAFFVEWALAAGVDVVIPDFNAVTDIDGDLHVLHDQVRRALLWVRQSLAQHHRANAAIHLGGHSSGAHLAACLASDASLCEGVQSLTLCSGLYDLEPVSHSARSQYVRFTEQTVDALSPMRHLAQWRAPVTVLCGTQESPEFICQAQALHAALQHRGHDTRWVWGEGLNHFEILATLEDEHGVLSQCLRSRWPMQPSQHPTETHA